MDSVKGQRLAALEQRNPGITEAATWVADNQACFRGRVYGPIISEVEMGNQQHAAMLEQHVQSEASETSTNLAFCLAAEASCIAD